MNLSPRDKRALLFLAGASVIFVLFLLVLSGGEGGSRESDLKRARKLKEEFFKNFQEHRRISAQVDAIDLRISRTPPDFDLFGALGKIEEELGIQDKIGSKTKGTAESTAFYSQSHVTMELKKITLEELVGLLTKIEGLNDSQQAFVRVAQLSVKRSFREEERSLDVTIKVAVYSRPGETAP